MAQAVSLFPRYSQRENLATNYVLLVLRLIYEQSPALLRRVLNAFLQEGVTDDLGVRFEQQPRRKESIPDGLVFQSPFSLQIETKMAATFDIDQLKRHLADFGAAGGKKILVALGAGEIDPHRLHEIDLACQAESTEQLAFFARSFEDLVQALAIAQSTPSLMSTVEEFKQFCNDEGLISKWRDRLDVVNAADSIERAIQDKAYFCPATGGAYSHQRCEYLGLYRNKSVSRVGRLRGVVDVDLAEIPESRLLWNNSGEPAAALIGDAQRLAGVRERTEPSRVFLVEKFLETDFKKSAPGGMVQHKRYFNVALSNASSTEELAAWLTTKTWETI
jgi:hypothetical protein